MSAIPTVTLYGERGTATVNEADAPAWLLAGWSREPFVPAPEPAPEPAPVPAPEPVPAQAKKGKA